MINRRLLHVATDPSHTSPQVTPRMAAAVLGVELFARSSRHVELTTTGHALLPLAKNVVDAADALRNAVLRATSGTGRLRLGVCESFAALESTRSMIATTSALYPDLDPDVRVVDSFIDQLALLSDGEIDAAFVYLPVPEGIYAQPLAREPRLACVADTDPLALRSSVRLTDLADYPVVSLAPETFRAGRDFWAVDPRPDGSRVRYTTHQVTRLDSLLSAVSLGGRSRSSQRPQPSSTHGPICATSQSRTCQL